MYRVPPPQQWQHGYQPASATASYAQYGARASDNRFPSSSRISSRPYGHGHHHAHESGALAPHQDQSLSARPTVALPTTRPSPCMSPPRLQNLPPVGSPRLSPSMHQSGNGYGEWAEPSSRSQHSPHTNLAQPITFADSNGITKSPYPAVSPGAQARHTSLPRANSNHSSPPPLPRPLGAAPAGLPHPHQHSGAHAYGPVTGLHSHAAPQPRHQSQSFQRSRPQAPDGLELSSPPVPTSGVNGFEYRRISSSDRSTSSTPQAERLPQPAGPGYALSPKQNQLSQQTRPNGPYADR